MINRERLAETFKRLVSIDSVSKEEGALAAELAALLSKLGAEIIVDSAWQQTGSDTGNLMAKLAGNRDAAPLLLSAHMDTVEPGRGIKAVIKDGVFTSDGPTVLGADDKSAIAILLEVLQVLKEDRLEFGPLELVFTTCEEIGLQGAKNLEFEHIRARYGYVLDGKDTEGIITRAPAANRFKFKIYGKAAHAGAAPEKGINAIWLAARAIAGIELGRIDRETTCNIGMIEGGTGTNIVPEVVTVKGEVRSHDADKLASVTNRIIDSFKKAVCAYPGSDDMDGSARIEVFMEKDFSGTHIPDDHPIVSIARQAAEKLGRSMVSKISGGGADANVFFERGIIAGVLGTGMHDVHTVNETVSLDEMVKATELLLEIIRLHAIEYS